MFPEVNPFAESTWRNHPAPREFPEFVRALRELGGTHPNGTPMLRLQWAPDHYQVQLGRPRRYYVDTRIPTRKKLSRVYYQVKDLTDPFASWITIEPNDLGRYPGEAYLHVVHHDREVVTIARQQYCVEQYFTPERLGDTPENWNSRRHRMFVPPETGLPIFGDADGPFPSQGLYRLVFFIDNGSEYSYRAPAEDTLNVLRAAWTRREQYRLNVSQEKRDANSYAAHDERERKRLEELDALLDDELKPYDRAAQGNAFVSVL